MRSFVCIKCPRGCQLTVDTVDGMITVCGNTCVLGEAYARDEMISPMRMVATTVSCAGSSKRLPAATSAPVAKARIPDVLRASHMVKASLPIEIGAIIVKNIAKSGADLVATRDMEEHDE